MLSIYKADPLLYMAYENILSTLSYMFVFQICKFQLPERLGILSYLTLTVSVLVPDRIFQMALNKLVNCH